MKPTDPEVMANAIQELVKSMDALNLRLDIQRKSMESLDQRLGALEKALESGYTVQ